MKLVIIDAKAAFHFSEDGLSEYHATMFHGEVVNTVLDDNNLGDALVNPLQLGKNAYDMKWIFKPSRNLVVPESAKEKLSSVANISFFEVVFRKLFFMAYRKGDLSFAPDDYRDRRAWLKAFPHVQRLHHEIERFFELIVPAHPRVVQEFTDLKDVQFRVNPHRASQLKLSTEMSLKYPIMWTVEGIVIRGDVFDLIEDYFVWDYFFKTEITLDE